MSRGSRMDHAPRRRRHRNQGARFARSDRASARGCFQDGILGGRPQGIRNSCPRLRAGQLGLFVRGISASPRAGRVSISRDLTPKIRSIEIDRAIATSCGSRARRSADHAARGGTTHPSTDAAFSSKENPALCRAGFCERCGTGGGDGAPSVLHINAPARKPVPARRRNSLGRGTKLRARPADRA
jgi:hypothetical protein